MPAATNRATALARGEQSALALSARRAEEAALKAALPADEARAGSRRPPDQRAPLAGTSHPG